MTVPPSLPPPLPPSAPPSRHRRLGLLLGALGLALAALIYWRTVPGIEEPGGPIVSTDASVDPKTVSTPRRSLDVDKLIAEYPSRQELLRQLDTATIVEYDHANPPDRPWYAEGRQAARLFAVFTVWSDFYCQGVLQTSDDFAAVAYKKGCRDPLIVSICDVFTFQSHHSSKKQGALEHIAHTRAMEASGYPTLLKFVTTSVLLKNLTSTKTNDKTSDGRFAAAWAEFPKFVPIATAEFRTLLKENLPPEVLFSRTQTLLDGVQESEYLVPIGDGIEAAFLAEASNHPARAALRGAFYQAWAWQARGTGWASTVTEEGSRLLAERLAEGDRLLTAAYEKNPEDYLAATVMLGIELGEGKGRDMMEQWFDRAMRGHPDNFRAVTAKMWYLQPRWYGSPSDVVNFGRECVKTGNWPAKIPLALPLGIGNIADQNKDLYHHDEVWNLVAPVYEEYLKHYPDSIGMRTTYANCAARGGRLDVLRRQLAALDGTWDREQWSTNEYRRISKLAK